MIYRSQVDLFAEKQYNEKCGLLYPHCAICQYFWPRDTWFVQGVPVSEVPPKSRRFVHEQVFHKDDEVHRSNFDIEEDDLLSCDNCKVSHSLQIIK